MMQYKLLLNALVKAQIYIKKSVLERLKTLAQQQGRAYSELIREAIDKFLQEHAKEEIPKKRDWVSELEEVAVDMGDMSSQNIDDILYSWPEKK